MHRRSLSASNDQRHQVDTKAFCDPCGSLPHSAICAMPGVMFFVRKLSLSMFPLSLLNSYRVQLCMPVSRSPSHRAQASARRNAASAVAEINPLLETKGLPRFQSIDACRPEDNLLS